MLCYKHYLWTDLKSNLKTYPIIIPSSNVVNFKVKLIEAKRTLKNKKLDKIKKKIEMLSGMFAGGSSQASAHAGAAHA